jgi:hypothetical protein
MDVGAFGVDELDLPKSSADARLPQDEVAGEFDATESTVAAHSICTAGGGSFVRPDEHRAPSARNHRTVPPFSVRKKDRLVHTSKPRAPDLPVLGDSLKELP